MDKCWTPPVSPVPALPSELTEQTCSGGPQESLWGLIQSHLLILLKQVGMTLNTNVAVIMQRVNQAICRVSNYVI